MSGRSDLRSELFRLEHALAARDPAGIEGGLMALIADDFLEFGASGSVWTAGSIAEVLAEPTRHIELAEFRVFEIGPDAALAIYRVAGAQPSNRSSLWLRRDGRWVMRFHQGTLRPDPAAG